MSCKELSFTNCENSIHSLPAIEEIVLRYSGRGMNILHNYLHSDYCRQAAQKILNLERGNILLTTGFCVAGAPETDGPPGTFVLAQALEQLGFTATIVTDRLCEGLFECSSCESTCCKTDSGCSLSHNNINVEYVDLTADAPDFQKILNRYQPVCLISIERCGRNINNDYANMRGISIAAQTACIDIMFEMAARHNILTIGIGDGGNEIGMGNLKDVISDKLNLVPCAVTVDELIIATTSNWGAYALVAYLEQLNHTHVMMSYEEIAAYLKSLVAKGCVDGVTKKKEPSVDGFSLDIEKEIITSLVQAVHAA